jgi:hypothetical protein
MYLKVTVNDIKEVSFHAYLQGPIQLISGIPQAGEVHQQFGLALSSLFLSHELVFHPAISCRINKIRLEKHNLSKNA